MVVNLILGLVCLIILLAFQDKGKGLISAFVLITLFWCLRYDWGNDYMAYLNSGHDLICSQIGIFDFSDLAENSHNEYGWSFLIILFGRLLGLGYFGFVMVLSVFENWIIYRFIKNNVKKKYYWLSIVLYVFSTSTFVVGASMMRQFLCICCFLLIFDWMLKKKLLRSVIVILLCSTVHRSNVFILLFLPFFYIPRIKKSIKGVWVVFAILFFVLWSYFMPQIFGDNIVLLLDYDETLSGYSTYLASENSVEKGGLGMVFQYLVLTYTIVLLPKLNKKNQTIAILFAVSYLFRPLGAVVPMISRYSMYLTIFGIALWPLFLKYSDSKLIARIFLACCLVVMTKSFFSFYYDPIWIQRCLHYHTIFEAPSWM